MFRLFKKILIDWCLQKTDMSIEDIYKKSKPRIVQINGPDNQLKFTSEGKTDLLVETPSGWSPVNRVLRTVPYDVWELQLEDGKKLHAADEHLIMTPIGECHLKNLIQGDQVLTREGISTVKSVIKTDKVAPMYDLELNDNDHVFYTNGILSHNTTVVAMYILWLTSFNSDKLCIIASKAMNHATEISSRIKFAYEELPHWLKPGCKYYSRTSIEFDNGSKIKSEATSEKTGRGSSPSFLMIDEIAFLSKRIQDEMWASLAPALSTGGKFVLTSTPNGDTDLFANLWRGANSGLNNFFPVKALWYQHPDRGPEYYKEMQGKLGVTKTLQELDCQFLSSDALLVSSIKLQQIKTVNPLSENMGFKFWKESFGGNTTYLVGVDPATGNGNDFTAIEVVEFPSLEQVAELRINSIQIPLIYAKIKWLLKFLRKPNEKGKKAEVIWSFERNGVGEALVAMIQNDDSADGGVYIDGVDLYNEHHSKLGVYTTGKSKILACMQLKNLLEKTQNGLKINSNTLHFELQNFIASGGSYQAKAGSTDDTIMAMCVVMKLLHRLSSYDDTARSIVYEAVEPDADTVSDEFGDSPVPFTFI